MITKVISTDVETEPAEKRIRSLPILAESILDQALDRAREKMPQRQRESKLAGLLKRHDFMAYFKYALAQEVAQVLTTYDRRILAVYLFEESENPDAETEDYLPSVDLTVHLLAVVTSSSAALEAFIASLDRALTEAIRELPFILYAGRTSIFDVLPVTLDDIANKRGYAVLLSSFYAPPLKIWARD